jgi:uncharacterized repeat protein (TIGR03803 family)
VSKENFYRQIIRHVPCKLKLSRTGVRAKAQQIKNQRRTTMKNQMRTLLSISIAIVVTFVTTMLTPPAWAQETVLYNFCSQPGCTDGSYPYGNLIEDKQNNLYGTTKLGGANDKGTVFELTAASGYTAETVLYSFCQKTNCADGEAPTDGLYLDPAGKNLYGTTVAGGKHGNGEVFKLNTSTGKLTKLYDFGKTGSGDGANPPSGLFGPSGGYFYGVTEFGGSAGCSINGSSGCGTIFRIRPSGSGYDSLYSFKGWTDNDGAEPLGTPLLIGSTIYGTTYEGGLENEYDVGAIYKCVVNGSRCDETEMYVFKGYPSDGDGPYSGLILSRNVLYGADQNGGIWDCVNEISKQQGCGTLFSIHTDGSGYQSLANFSGSLNGSDDGIYPQGVPVLVGGTLYGTTYYGGNGSCTDSTDLSGCGTLYSWTKAGNESAQYSFQGAPGDGANPNAGIMPVINGTLYGTTVNGGTNNFGTVYSFGTGNCGPGNLIANCNFLQPQVPRGGLTIFCVGSTIGPWTVVGPSGTCVNTVSSTFMQYGFTFDAQNGNQFMDLTGYNSNSTEGVSQTVNTKPGALYELSFWVGNVNDPNGTFGPTATVEVQVNGTSIGEFSNSEGMGDMFQVWEKFTQKIKATSKQTTIAFINESGSSDYNTGLDNVQLRLVKK